jgi:hypothetical protein
VPYVIYHVTMTEVGRQRINLDTKGFNALGFVAYPRSFLQITVANFDSGGLDILRGVTAATRRKHSMSREILEIELYSRAKTPNVLALCEKFNYVISKLTRDQAIDRTKRILSHDFASSREHVFFFAQLNTQSLEKA